MFDLTLTFDNGPDPDVTPFVLDVLARRGIRTTFFVIGQKLATHRALCARAHAEGHWIGNHTWTHSVALGLQTGPGVAAREVGRTQSLLGELAHPSRLFRPMGGGGVIGPHLLSPPVLDYLQTGRFTCVLWNAIPRDWLDPDGWVATALAQLRAQHWTLMVVHDLPTGAMRHLERFLDAVAEAGGTLRQDFPAGCVPLLAGEPVLPLTSLVAA